ncbi:hypothetical protein RvY_18892 [Ramazzottius varieornatus]|uniref:DUF1279 domain-containing protein n=1 Tax=Ramazzottius varieornatus TaxID=947166 RepID=A0A1D1W8T3_RAMVA|nr:hypothetical protein RvY_18892 [Ramazzottius varieornatus]
MSVPRSVLDYRYALFLVCRQGEPRARTLRDVISAFGHPSLDGSCDSRSFATNLGSNLERAVRCRPVLSKTGGCTASIVSNEGARRGCLQISRRASDQLLRFQAVRPYSQTPSLSQPNKPSPTATTGNTSSEGQNQMRAGKVTFDPRRNDADQFYQQLKKLTSPPSSESSSHLGSLWLRFKTMYKAYWYVLIPVHGMLSVGWYGLFYLLALRGFDATPVLAKLGLPESVRGAGYLATAFVMYKIAGPLRYSATLGITTLTINYLKKRNLIKPVPTSAQMRRFITDKSHRIRTKRRLKRSSPSPSKPLTLKQRIQLLFRRSKSRYSTMRNGMKTRGQTLDS